MGILTIKPRLHAALDKKSFAYRLNCNNSYHKRRRSICMSLLHGQILLWLDLSLVVPQTNPPLLSKIRRAFMEAPGGSARKTLDRNVKRLSNRCDIFRNHNCLSCTLKQKTHNVWMTCVFAMVSVLKPLTSNSPTDWSFSVLLSLPNVFTATHL